MVYYANMFLWYIFVFVFNHDGRIEFWYIKFDEDTVSFSNVVNHFIILVEFLH